MATVDLLFKNGPLTGSPVALVYNEDSFDAITTKLDAAGTFPVLSFAAELSLALEMSFAATFPELSFVSVAKYQSNAARPIVGSTIARHQVARRSETGAEHRSRSPLPLQGFTVAPWTRAAMLNETLRANMPATFVRMPNSVGQRFTRAARLLPGAVEFKSQNALHDVRLSRVARFQEGVDLRAVTTARWQVMLRDRRATLAERYQEARAMRHVVTSRAQVALPMQKGWGGKWQDAIRPPAGTTVIVVPPVEPFDPCYLPDSHLLFDAPWSSDTGLVFICERHLPPPPASTVVIPIQRVYMVLNNTALRRVSDNALIPALALTLSIDFESWTWSFSASVPASAQQYVESSNGDPVELSAVINGTTYRVLAESLSRERTFGRASIRVQGRGRGAVLDSPYAPSMTFGNADARTAQQLMADVLTVNGASIGWGVDFGLTDWLVPAGVWSHQGSYISAINAIASAAGGYVQPHATDKTLRVLPRYPVAPWEWGTVSPDVEIPSSIATREGIAWVKRPDYNRVFVTGQQDGLLGQVTRAGTAGDVLAPMVTDALMTHVDAIRQRGVAVLGDTGPQAQVSLRMPVVADYGGLIVPGKFVRYVDGSDVRVGIVRSTSVDVGGADVWQTIGVETHVA